MSHCLLNIFFAVRILVGGVQAGHGSMITPAPRSAHGQKYDDANKCSCKESGDCYSNITGVAQYCGVGCLGEACLYYQIGCYAGCGTCSYSGKDLYPTAEDLQLAGDCEPIEPTLPEEFRSYNIDSESTKGDWTKVNPWRSPGTAGRGNPAFQPCGVNSGWQSAHPVRGSAGPPTSTEPIGANGTDLPPVGAPTVWEAGKTAEVEFSIYANHAGGYAYRLCKADPHGVPTEECFQAGHLEFATEDTRIVYHDGSRQPFNISARTVSTGTWPTGSQWRLNPIPMCNCDQGAYCGGKEADAETAMEPELLHRMLQEEVAGKTCKAVPRAECGTETGVNTCLKCGNGSTYDCEECCPGCEQTSKDGYKYCNCNGPKPPVSKCDAVEEEVCGAAKKQGVAACDNCLKVHSSELEAAGCTSTTVGQFCSGKKPNPGPQPVNTQFQPYPKTHLRPGQTSSACPTGLMFNSSWDDGAGSGPNANGYGDMPYSMVDQVKVPHTLGHYILSWRWDCEQTPQVWNSCADIVIV